MVSGRGSVLKKWGARLLLALGSLVVFFLLAELFIRYSDILPVPLQHRDDLGDYYTNPLPLLFTIDGDDSRIARGKDSARLPTEKRPDELRVAFFGESSMEGVPYSQEEAPPNLFLTEMRRLYPALDLTVINMARGGSTMMDAFYYLQAIQRFEPDVIVFYQGINDLNFGFRESAESGWPLSYPVLYPLWQGLVSRSQFLLSVRLLGKLVAERLLPLEAARVGREDFDVPRAAQFWASSLVEAAARSGAAVFVTTPIDNVLNDHLSFPLGGPRGGNESRMTIEAELAAFGQKDRDLLACLLEQTCDLGAFFTRHGLPRESRHMILMNEVWRRAAEEHGAVLVDFRERLVPVIPHGVFTYPTLTDDIHLSLVGYESLARSWISAFVEEGLVPPPPDDVFHMPLDFEDPAKAPSLSHCENYYLTYLLSGNYLLATGLVMIAAHVHEDEYARLILARLRAALGLPPGVSPAEAERARALDLDSFLKEMAAQQRHAQW